MLPQNHDVQFSKRFKLYYLFSLDFGSYNFIFIYVINLLLFWLLHHLWAPMFKSIQIFKTDHLSLVSSVTESHSAEDPGTFARSSCQNGQQTIMFSSDSGFSHSWMWVSAGVRSAWQYLIIWRAVFVDDLYLCGGMQAREQLYFIKSPHKKVEMSLWSLYNPYIYMLYCSGKYYR